MHMLHRASRLCGAGILVGLGCGVMPQVIVGQQIPMPGTRVRVFDLDSRQPVATGTFVRLVGDTVILATSTRSESAVALRPDYRWQVSDGLRRQTMRGAGAGFLVGALSGALVGFFAEVASCHNCMAPYYGASAWRRAALSGAALGGGVGIVIGGVAGAFMHREQWLPVIRRAPPLGIVPAGPRSAALVLSVGF